MNPSIIFPVKTRCCSIYNYNYNLSVNRIYEFKQEISIFKIIKITKVIISNLDLIPFISE